MELTTTPVYVHLPEDKEHPVRALQGPFKVLAESSGYSNAPSHVAEPPRGRRGVGMDKRAQVNHFDGFVMGNVVYRRDSGTHPEVWHAYKLAGYALTTDGLLEELEEAPRYYTILEGKPDTTTV